MKQESLKQQLISMMAYIPEAKKATKMDYIDELNQRNQLTQAAVHAP